MVFVLGLRMQVGTQVSGSGPEMATWKQKTKTVTPTPKPDVVIPCRS